VGRGLTRVNGWEARKPSAKAGKRESNNVMFRVVGRRF
jgi:hypothetical protein